MFAETASKFRSRVTVSKGRQVADGKSVLSLMLLGAAPGVRITITADGEDEAEALAALAPLFEKPGTEYSFPIFPTA
jgi:phosphotransferase system HPr (HPr) family protein